MSFFNAGLTAWLTLTVICYFLFLGWLFADLVDRFQEGNDRYNRFVRECKSFSLVWAIMWPIGLVVCYNLTDGFKKGWRLPK